MLKHGIPASIYPYAKAKVEARQHLDGAWTVTTKDHNIAQAPPTPLAEPLRYLRHRTAAARTRGARQELFLYLPQPHPARTLSLGS